MIRRRLVVWVAYLVTAYLAAAVPAMAGNPYRDLLAKADALVTVKFVLKVKMDGANSQEFDGEITCQVIDAEGLVLCSNTELGGYITVMSRVMGGGSSLNVSAAPTEVEVLLPGATDALRARLLTRDTDRDLAWIRIEEALGDAPPAFIDLRDSAEPEIGEKVYNLRRLHKYFGSEALVEEGTIVAEVRKPRRLLVPSNPTPPGFGVPVFTAGGALVGITVLQVPGAEDPGSRSLTNPIGALGTSVVMQDMINGLILPAAEVVKATQLAREVFAEEDEEEAEAASPPH